MFRAVVLLALLTACASTSPHVVGSVGREVEVVQIPLAWSNVFLLDGPAPVLIDAGSEGDLDALEEGLASRGVAMEDLEAIILTHGHADHAGMAANLAVRSGAAVYVGAGDLDMARTGRNRELHPTSFFAGILTLFVPDRYPAFEPTAVHEPTRLSLRGVTLELVPMAGHTPGSLVVVVGDQAFVGDLMLGGGMGGAVAPHCPGEHYFHDDRPANAHNVRRLLDRGVNRFFLGHGGPVEREAVADVFR